MPRILFPIAGLFVVALVHACNIPVFRYALERWRPDPCEIIVFHREPVTKSQHQTIGSLETLAPTYDGPTHLRVILSNVGGDQEPDHRELWQSLPDDAKSKAIHEPYTVVRCKVTQGRQVNVWHGRLSEVKALGITQSPARDEMSRRLLAGDSVVWLMIRSVNESKNARARDLLRSQFETLADKIELPEGVGLPGSELFADVPLLLKFSLLEIEASDAKEQFLIKLLTGMQQEAFAAGEPLLVPVFGRGRALAVIPASDLNEHRMEDLTVFLSGACSCQVKEQNPGFDLLISTDWDTELFGADGEVPADTPQRQRQTSKPKLLTIPKGK
ncbi:MAG: hypothetical protein HKN47_22495 [Pirellulaceae bacterium]|nr:hypothetical protein [Pirellulaceae bacterium]